MDTIIIFGAKYLIAVVVLLAGFVWLQMPKAEKRSCVFRGVFSLPLTLGIARLVSSFWYNPRPFVVEHITPLVEHAPDNGFPSDHTLLGAALAALIYSYNKKWGTVLYSLTILVGASRVLASVHHAVDILGSLVIASLITVLVVSGEKLYVKHLQKKTSAL